MSIDPDIYKENIILIIPAYEPDDRFPVLIADIRRNFSGHIVVVNDGSGPAYDRYYIQAEEQGCEVLKHAVNLGKGRALKDAFNYCLNTYPDLKGAVTADSDGQHLPEDIYKVMKELADNPEDLILGCRDFSQKDVPFKSRLGNRLTIGTCRYMCGVKVSDTQTGLRGIPASFMAELMNVSGERFEFETRMLIAAKDEHPVREVTINTVYDSKENHQTHYDPVKDSIRIGRIFAGVFAKFLFSSLSSTVIDLFLFHLFCPMLKPMTGLYYAAIATAMARVISAVYNYIINYKLVFKSRASYGSSALKYVCLAVIQGSCSALFITLAVAAFPAGNETFMKAVIDVCLFFISYAIQRSFVF